MLRRTLLNLAYPFLKKAGKLHAPWTRKLITESDVNAILERAVPGDIILAMTRGEFTDICIPGFWKHTAMFTQDMKVLEAVDPKVRKVSVYDFFMHKDYIAIMRPNNIPAKDCMTAAIYAESSIGDPYDYQFEMGKDKPKAFYCAELPYWAYRVSSPDFNFRLKEVLGVNTITPEDYWKATKHFSTIWASSTTIPK